MTVDSLTVSDPRRELYEMARAQAKEIYDTLVRYSWQTIQLNLYWPPPVDDRETAQRMICELVLMCPVMGRRTAKQTHWLSKDDWGQWNQSIHWFMRSVGEWAKWLSKEWVLQFDNLERELDIVRGRREPDAH